MANYSGGAPTVSLEYSTDEGQSWNVFKVSGWSGDNWESANDGTIVTLSNVGDKVYFRCGSDVDNGQFGYESYYNFFQIMGGRVSASGNINSLLSRNFENISTVPEYCYCDLFIGCTSLTTAPELPATTLAKGCYFEMFCNCDSLTKAPELPATTLAYNCYSYIFYGCTSLNDIKVSFMDWDLSNATYSWVSSVNSSGRFICPEALPEERGISRIPEGWTIVRV